MTKKFRLQQYTPLAMILAAILTVVGLIIFNNNTQQQLEISTALIIFYLVWAIIHHLIDKSLTLEIILEYVLVAGLAFVVLYGLLF